MLDLLSHYLLLLVCHSSLLLGAVALTRPLLRRQGLLEAAWRTALLLPWLSAAVVMAPALPTQGTPTTAPTFEAAAAPLGALSPLAAPTPSAAPAPPAAIPPTPTRVAVAQAALSPDVLAGSLLRLLALVWVAGATLGLLRWGRDALHLRRQVHHHLRTLPPCEAPDLHQQAQAWAIAQCRRTPRLLALPAGAEGPWAWGGCVAVPGWLLRALDPAEREVVLAHELAHLQRRDPFWRGLTHLSATLLWWQPLQRLALRDLDALMEAACDARAADAPPRRRALARSLVCAAEHHLHAAPAPAFALAALGAAGGDLVTRTRALLEPSMSLFHQASRPVRFALFGGLLLAVLAVPAVQLPPGLSPGEGLTALRSALGSLGMDGGSRWVSTSPGLRRELRWTGALRFSADGSRITGAEGPVVLRERRGDLTREWTLTPVDGSWRAAYRRQGVEAPMDAEAQAWLREITLHVYDSVADPRALMGTYRTQGDLPGALAYLSRADTDHARRERLVALLAQWPAEALPQGLAERMVAHAAGIRSDHDARQALAALARHGVLQAPGGAAAWPRWWQAATQLGSDFDRAEFVVQSAAQLPAGAAEREALLRAFGSDHDRRRALEALWDAQPEPASLAWALPALRAMGSAFDQRSAFVRLVNGLDGEGDTAALREMAEAAQHLASPFERGEALRALLARQPRDAQVLRAVLAQAEGLDGAHERLQVLLGTAPLLTGELHPAYRSAARPLPPYERGVAEQALDR